MPIFLSKPAATELRRKLLLLAENDDLLEEYGITEDDATNAAMSVPVDGGASTSPSASCGTPSRRRPSTPQKYATALPSVFGTSGSTAKRARNPPSPRSSGNFSVDFPDTLGIRLA
jgi:hypothetical protein